MVVTNENAYKKSLSVANWAFPSGTWLVTKYKFFARAIWAFHYTKKPITARRYGLSDPQKCKLVQLTGTWQKSEAISWITTVVFYVHVWCYLCWGHQLEGKTSRNAYNQGFNTKIGLELLLKMNAEWIDENIHNITEMGDIWQQTSTEILIEKKPQHSVRWDI